MAKQTWTIMVYMAGDNNLSSDMAYSLNEITDLSADLGIQGGDEVKMTAFYDSGSITMPTFYFDLSNPGNPTRYLAAKTNRPYRTTWERRREEEARNAGDGVEKEEENLEINSAQAYSIMNFVDWCVNEKSYKADNYALIFSGHSFGFHGHSFLRDESSASYMTIPKFKWTLEQINGTKLLNRKISILGFDSCVMSMLETAYEFREFADFMVASEGSIPNAGWSYGNIIRKLSVKDDAADAKTVAQKLVRAYVERHKYTENGQSSAIGGNSIDISAWDLSKVRSLAVAANELGKVFHSKLNLPTKKDGFDEVDLVVYEQLNRAILQSHWNSQTYMHNQCIDLKDFCLQMRIELSCLGNQVMTIFPEVTQIDNEVRSNLATQIQEIENACDSVIEAVDNCILLCGFSGEDYQFSNGVSLFFPWSELSYVITRSRYEKLEFTENIGRNWDDFLAFYVCLATKRLPRGFDFPKVFEVLSSQENLNRDNLPLKRDNLPLKRDNLPLKRGEVGNYLEHFGKMKNFPLQWDVSGYSHEFETKSVCQYFEWLKSKK